jgi:DNA-directed RNA polymerase specialized sigma24 family protein
VVKQESIERSLSDHIRFGELVLPYLDAACNLARWLTRDVNDAEGIVQDTCVRALRYVASLNGDSARAWFLTIVRHTFDPRGGISAHRRVEGAGRLDRGATAGLS